MSLSLIIRAWTPPYQTSFSMSDVPHRNNLTAMLQSGKRGWCDARGEAANRGTRGRDEQHSALGYSRYEC